MEAVIALAAIIGLVVVLVVVLVIALLRPTGPVTIHARDINVRQEAHVKVKVE